jgi:intracellular multiplication protein IcmP
MPPAPQQGQDSGLGPLWIGVGIAVVFGIAWLFLHTYIVEGFLQLKLWELKFIGLFTNAAEPIKEAIYQTAPNEVSFQRIIYIANGVGNYLAIPVAIALVIFSIFLFRKSMSARFCRTYSMKDLVKSENAIWSQTSPILGMNLVPIIIEEGPWAMAKTPMDYAKANKLLKVQEQVQDEGTLSRDVGMEATLIRSKAIQLFTKQMGPPWLGVDRLNMHVKALFAAFAAKANDDTKGSRALLSQIAWSSKTKKLNFSGTQELLNKHLNSPIVQSVINQHAFVMTMMPTMLELARTAGVLASADFLWLKPIDRRLWFMLNCVGRQTPTVEVAGAFAHWIIEKQLGRKIITPMVDEAVNALDLALKDVVYKPD